MNFEKMSEQEILDIANPIMDNLMNASTDIDHERHTRDFFRESHRIVSSGLTKRKQKELGLSLNQD